MIGVILESPLPFLGSSFFTGSLVLLYLDDFKLSNITMLKYIQIFYLFCIPLYAIYYIFTVPFISDIIFSVKDNNNIDLHGHVILDKEAGKAIGQGLSTIGTQFGLGATMVGVGTAVGKGIAKSSLPPVQKAGVILGASLIGGLFHSNITTVNRNKIMEENIKNNTVSAYPSGPSEGDANNAVSDNASSINKFIDDNTLDSPLKDLLLNLEITNYVCISMLILLIIQIVFKFHFKDNIKLKLSSILGIKLNENLEFFINKIITLNKKMSIIYIWLILITLMAGLFSSAYAIHELYNNIDSYINVHNSIHK